MPYRVTRPFQADQQWQPGDEVQDEQFERWPLGMKLIGRYLTPIKGTVPVPEPVSGEPSGAEPSRRRKE